MIGRFRAVPQIHKNVRRDEFNMPVLVAGVVWGSGGAAPHYVVLTHALALYVPEHVNSGCVDIAYVLPEGRSGMLVHVYKKRYVESTAFLRQYGPTG